jgi:hypothetical protein
MEMSGKLLYVIGQKQNKIPIINLQWSNTLNKLYYCIKYYDNLLIR